MTEKPKSAYSPIPDGQNPTAQTKRTDFASTKTPHFQTSELTQVEISQKIRELSQKEGNIYFKSLHS
jgi:hypothetical protein